MVNKPFTGRSRQYLLLPFSLEEIGQELDPIQIKASLPNLLRFGLYPQVFLTQLENSVPINQLKSIISIYFSGPKGV
jgi:hypothetical protein